MATQFKDLPTRPIPVPVSAPYPRPYADPRCQVRVGFSKGPATKAVAAKLAVPPSPDQTIADRPVPEAVLPLRMLLADRNACMEALNGPDAPPEADHGKMFEAIRSAETAILTRNGGTKEDAVARLVMIAQIAADGLEVDDTEAAAAIRGAQAHFGMGYVHERFGAATVVEPVADRTEWGAAYAELITARAARRQYEVTVYEPAAARFAAVRALFDPNHSFSRDPVGAAALKAVDYEDVEERFEELVDVEHKARCELLMLPAPSIEALGIKLSLYRSDEVYCDNIGPSATESMVVDARRLAGLGGNDDRDKGLLDRFAAIATQMRQARGINLSSADEQAYYEAVDENEQPFHARQAGTVEGAIAKLRVAFTHLVGEAWSDDAIVDPNSEAFRSGLAVADLYTRLTWAAIEDLARVSATEL